jgi:hypothetical protein
MDERMMNDHVRAAVMTAVTAAGGRGRAFH